MTINWLTADVVNRIHDDALALDGIGLHGQPANKDISAPLQRVENKHYYQGVEDILFLAASYCMAIAMGHIYNDANKRTSFTAMDVFLRMNGYELDMDKEIILDLIVETAKGALTQDELAYCVHGYLVELND